MIGARASWAAIFGTLLLGTWPARAHPVLPLRGHHASKTRDHWSTGRRLSEACMHAWRNRGGVAGGLAQ
jgi:hypothetical protein